MKTGEGQSMSDVDLQINSRDLEIGENYARRLALQSMWSKVVDKDPDAADQIKKLSESIKGEAKAEWVGAVLQDHGYRTDVEEVFLKPKKTTGWNEVDFTNIPQDKVYGEYVRVKVDLLDLDVGASRVLFHIPWTGQSAELVRIDNLSETHPLHNEVTNMLLSDSPVKSTVEELRKKLSGLLENIGYELVFVDGNVRNVAAEVINIRTGERVKILNWSDLSSFLLQESVHKGDNEGGRFNPQYEVTLKEGGFERLKQAVAEGSE